MEQLPLEFQLRVYEYVVRLAGKPPAGEPGASLVASAGVLDAVSAQEMMDAIETDCERIHATEW